MHILVVDDNEFVLNTLTNLLEQAGHTVESAQNGLDGFEKAQNKDFDLFIVDHLMPVMNGLQLAKNLYHTEVTKHVPVIFMTTQDIEMVSALGESTFFDVIMAKPIDKDQLFSSIMQLAIKNTHRHSL